MCALVVLLMSPFVAGACGRHLARHYCRSTGIACASSDSSRHQGVYIFVHVSVCFFYTFIFAKADNLLLSKSGVVKIGKWLRECANGCVCVLDAQCVAGRV